MTVHWMISCHLLMETMKVYLCLLYFNLPNLFLIVNAKMDACEEKAMCLMLILFIFFIIFFYINYFEAENLIHRYLADLKASASSKHKKKNRKRKDSHKTAPSNCIGTSRNGIQKNKVWIVFVLQECTYLLS